MGRRPLIGERKHPLYYKMQPLESAAQHTDATESSADTVPAKDPEWFMEQVMEGLSDACMLVTGTGRRASFISRR